MELKTVLVTQARCGSTRLPRKILKEVNGKTLLQIHLDRLSKCSLVSEMIVATTKNPDDLIICDKVLKWGFEVFRGSELDVLDRFYQAVKYKNASWIVRVTSDCPLLDPILVDNVIDFVQKSNMDYGSNCMIENFPDGQDVEVFKFSALENAHKNAKLTSEREHVTPYIKNNSNGKGLNCFTAIDYLSSTNYSNIRMTVDEAVDFKLIEILINKLGIDKPWLDYTNYIIDNNLGNINNHIIRNEGWLKSLKNEQ